MDLEHEFTVPVPVEQAWPVLLDVDRVAPCMPGATLDTVEGDEFTGRLKVKVGPITVTYRGKARFTGKDEQAHKVTIEGSGKEARGSGTASATVRAQLHGEGDTTRVTVHTTLNVTGRPAQFGRNVMAEVGSKLVGQFADCLARELAGPGPEEAAAAEAVAAGTGPSTTEQGPAAAAEARRAAPPPPPRPQVPRQSAEAIDLLDVAGGPVLKRAAPAIGALTAIFAIVFLVRRKRRH